MAPRIVPSTSGSRSPYSRPPRSSDSPTPAASRKAKRGGATGSAFGRTTKGSNEKPSAGAPFGKAGGKAGKSLADVSNGATPKGPNALRAPSALSALAPSFSFNPTSASFVPASPATPESLSPLASTFQPTSPTIIDDEAAAAAEEESPATEVVSDAAVHGLGLDVPTEATATDDARSEHSVSLEELVVEELEEGEIREEVEPAEVEKKETEVERTLILEEEEPIAPLSQIGRAHV